MRIIERARPFGDEREAIGMIIMRTALPRCRYTAPQPRFVERGRGTPLDSDSTARRNREDRAHQCTGRCVRTLGLGRNSVWRSCRLTPAALPRTGHLLETSLDYYLDDHQQFAVGISYQNGRDLTRSRSLEQPCGGSVRAD
jgi:hypothetical protein